MRKHITAGETGWKVKWYPAGTKCAREGFCSLFINQYSKVSFSVWGCCTLLKDGKPFLTRYLGWTSRRKFSSGWTNLAKINDFNGKISLKLKIRSSKLHFQRSSLQGCQKIVKALHKDVKLASGKASAFANSAVLRHHSPVFSAMLNLDHGFVESQQKSIILDEVFEKFLNDFLDFLYEGEVEDLEISDEAHYEKFHTLITLADKYQVKSLRKYILWQLIENPSEPDISNRLLLLSKFKHLPRFKEAGESLLEWANKSLSQSNFKDLVKTIIFTPTDDEL